MAIKYAIDKFPVAYPSKVIARDGGAHVYSLTAQTDCWNGAVVAKGDYVSLDLYKEATAGAVNLKIVDQAANGNFYVEVMEDVPAATALFVYNVPMIEEDYNTSFKSLSNYYIPANTVMRCYALREGDVWELSKEAFSGTPAVGKTVTTITGKKLVIA